MTYPPQPGPYGGNGGYGQPYSGQPYSGQPYPGQPEYQGQYVGQSYPDQPEYQGQQYPGYPGYQGQQFPNQPYRGQAGRYAQPQREDFPGGFSHQQPGYGAPPGGYPPPQRPPEPRQKQRRTGLVVGVTLALLLIAGAAVAITGFWQPGYFRGDDSAQQASAPAAANVPAPAQSTSSTPQQTSTPAPTDDDAEIRRIADTVAAGINSRDASTVKPVSCDPSKEQQADYDGFAKDLRVTISGEPAISGDSATVELTLTRSGNSKQVDLQLRRANGSWCAAGVD